LRLSMRCLLGLARGGMSLSARDAVTLTGSTDARTSLVGLTRQGCAARTAVVESPRHAIGARHPPTEGPHENPAPRHRHRHLQQQGRAGHARGEVLRSAVVPHGISTPPRATSSRTPTASGGTTCARCAGSCWTARPSRRRRGGRRGERHRALPAAAGRGGRPLRPGILYGVDVRAAEDIEALDG
jgi:hypothetical protein